MEYRNLVEDFARRTRENLRILRAAHERGEHIYEVTALINSMLGLLVFPQQKYVNSIPETSLEELSVQGWPIPVVVGDFPQVLNLRQLIRNLRNAVSHFNIEFYTEGGEQIAGLTVWNTKPRTRQVTWKATLSISELDIIVHKFITLILRD
jgi:hypothetical protein